MIKRIGLTVLLVAGNARAEPVQASYAAYAAGLNVINMDAAFDVAPARYRVHLVYRTAGAFGALVSGQQDTMVEGRFAEGRAVPQRFYSAGTMRGQQRVTQIDYPAGQPVIRQLIPPADEEREPVSPERQANTIDTISAMAQLVHQVNVTGRCDGRVMTFDGRRLSELASRTVGEEILPATDRSSFAGQALRCTFEGRQLGGFMLDGDREALRRPQLGSAWFASAVPGGPKVPVRVVFHTRWFGEATMYLTERR